MQPSEPTVVDAGRTKGRFSPTVWTLLVFGIGLALGFVFDLVIPRTVAKQRLALFVTSDYIDIVVASIGLSFLVALLYLYNRTYAETHARFAAGLIAVLVALLFQSVLTYSVFYVALGTSHLAGPLTLAADAAEATAFGVFLYLGLQ